MKKEDIAFLEQMIKSLEDAEVKLEEANKNKDHEKFRKTKKFMMDIQKQMDSTIQ
ncbi:hypothetical protein GF378_01130 [Candidatus Pacearchaeota archaeon]|nr:hypothetical protein [Candidatus Pacearchaeota archaeon]